MFLRVSVRTNLIPLNLSARRAHPSWFLAVIVIFSFASLDWVHSTRPSWGWIPSELVTEREVDLPRRWPWSLRSWGWQWRRPSSSTPMLTTSLPSTPLFPSSTASLRPLGKPCPPPLTPSPSRFSSLPCYRASPSLWLFESSRVLWSLLLMSIAWTVPDPIQDARFVVVQFCKTIWAVSSCRYSR